MFIAGLCMSLLLMSASCFFASSIWLWRSSIVGISHGPFCIRLTNMYSISFQKCRFVLCVRFVLVSVVTDAAAWMGENASK